MQCSKGKSKYSYTHTCFDEISGCLIHQQTQYAFVLENRLQPLWFVYDSYETQFKIEAIVLGNDEIKREQDSVYSHFIVSFTNKYSLYLNYLH